MVDLVLGSVALPDLQRGIYPTVNTITRSGFGDVADDEIRRYCEAILGERGRL